jgi:hypothetical protein
MHGRSRTAWAVAGAGLLLALSGCGGSAKPAASEVPAKPGPFCNSVAQRRALGRHAPRLPFELRNIDVDNFSGANGHACNERQIIYWGPPPSIPTDDRAMISVRLSFVDDPKGALDLVALSKQGGERRIRIGSTSVVVTPSRGQYGARFAVGAAAVSVTVACVPRDQSFGTAPCLRPPIGPAELKRPLDIALAELVPALAKYL